MDCRTARDFLLTDGLPRTSRSMPLDLANHLAQCPDCQRLAAQVAGLDEAWRAIPPPAGMDRARDAFLAGLQESPPPPRVARRGRMPSQWAIAATTLLAVGLATSFVVGNRRARASSDVVERLVDWNLSLAQAPSAAERGRIYASRAPGFAQEVESVALPVEDRDLARSLLDDAPALVGEPDPLAEADRFDKLATRLVARINRAISEGDSKRVDQSATLYERVAELGISSKLAVIEASGSLDFHRRKRLERLILQDDDRIKSLVELLERVPDSSRKQIRRALGIKRKSKKAPAGVPGPGPARKISMMWDSRIIRPLVLKVEAGRDRTRTLGSISGGRTSS